VYLSEENTLNLRRLASLAQDTKPRLRERLVLYAIATGQVTRLRSYLYLEDYINELDDLALEFSSIDLNNPNSPRNDQLPPRYVKALQSYRAAFQQIDSRNESKKLRWEKSVQLQKKKGVSNAQIYQALNLDAGNVNAYMKHANIDKVSLKNATDIMEYLHAV